MIHGVEAIRIRKKRKKNTLISTVIKIIIITFFIYILVIQFFISPIKIQSESMLPGMGKGDIVIACPFIYGPKIPFVSFRFSGLHYPERGEIVAVSPPYYQNTHFMTKIIEPVVRFFTFQKESVIKDSDNRHLSKYSIKRIIGLPGDTVKMERFIAYIKPQDTSKFIQENELIEKQYSFLVKENFFPDKWQDIFPYSGNMEEYTLKQNEYFVLGDNRTGSNDSYSWGPVNFSGISGKIIFQYWPFDRFGIP